METLVTLLFGCLLLAGFFTGVLVHVYETEKEEESLQDHGTHQPVIKREGE